MPRRGGGRMGGRGGHRIGGRIHGGGGGGASQFSVPTGNEPYENDFKSSLFNVSECVDCFCCCYCAMGSIHNRLANDVYGPDSCCNNGCLIPVILDVFTCMGLGCISLCTLREGVRFRYGLRGDKCSSCCLSCWCRPCVIGQILGEMQAHEERPPTLCGSGQPLNEQYRTTTGLQAMVAGVAAAANAHNMTFQQQQGFQQQPAGNQVWQQQHPSPQNQQPYQGQQPWQQQQQFQQAPPPPPGQYDPQMTYQHQQQPPAVYGGQPMFGVPPQGYDQSGAGGGGAPPPPAWDNSGQPQPAWGPPPGQMS